jgi:hypothetical protein
MGSLARAMQDFFVERGLALPTDQTERLAAGRRQRRIDAVPAPLRPAVQAFSTEMMKNKQRARAAATRPRSDQTIEMTLGAGEILAYSWTLTVESPIGHWWMCRTWRPSSTRCQRPGAIASPYFANSSDSPGVNG